MAKVKRPKPIQNLKDVVPQRMNANRHTPRGLGLLEESIQQRGWIGAITVAADGEAFDGSARIEVGAAAGLEDAIVVESDGSKPVIHRRTDIPSADDPRAIELSVAANRVAALDLDWDADVLARWKEEGIEFKEWTAEEWAEVMNQVPNFTPASIDEQGRLDEKKKVECPKCGCVFEPK